MRVAVLCSPQSWYLRDLQRAAGDRHEVFSAPFSRVRAELPSGKVSSGPHVLSDCDAVIVRTMPPGSLEQIVFRMDALARLQAAGVQVLNPPRALEISVDKYLTSALLQAADLPTPRTWIGQTAEEAMEAFEQFGERAVVKPLFGGEGRGVMMVEENGLAMRVFKTLEQTNSVIYLQEFLPHIGCDYRLLVLGEQVLAIRRRHPTDWRTNLSRGAIAEPLEAKPEWIEMAKRAAAAVRTPFAGVDLLPGEDGRVHVLEVNAVPGWKGLSRTLKVDVAAMVWKWLEALVLECRH